MHLCCKSIINDLKYDEFTFVTGLFKTDMTLIYLSTIALTESVSVCRLECVRA